MISDNGYSLLLGSTQNNHEKERKNLINMLNAKVAGLIIEPTQSALPNPNMDLYQEIKDDQIPTLFINANYQATYPQLNFPFIATADAAAERQLMDYLFSLGHESIIGVFQVDDIQGVHRMDGFVQAYQQHPDISYKSNLIMYQSGDALEKITQRIETYLKDDHRPTAIACYNDQLAIQVLAFVKQLGLRVPEDLSIVGFDNYQMAAYMSPALTTLNHEKAQMGQAAGNMIIDLLKHKTVESITYDPQLVLRRSATPPHQ